MAGEIVISYIPSQSEITANVYTPAGVLRIADVACSESFSGSGVYVGDYAAITPGDAIVAFHATVYIGGEIYNKQAALITTITDPDPAGGSTTDAVFDMVDGSAEDDEYINMVVSIDDVSGGITATRRIVDYDGANKRVTLDFPAEFPLDVADRITIWKNAYDSYSGPTASQTASAVWDKLKTDHKLPGTMGLLQGLHGWHD